MTQQGLAWTIKRYTDDVIVLQGCGDDEYKYRRLDRRDEQFMLCDKLQNTFEETKNKG